MFHVEYSGNEIYLQRSITERDLGIMIDCSLNFSEHTRRGRSREGCLSPTPQDRKKNKMGGSSQGAQSQNFFVTKTRNFVRSLHKNGFWKKNSHGEGSQPCPKFIWTFKQCTTNVNLCVQRKPNENTRLQSHTTGPAHSITSLY